MAVTISLYRPSSESDTRGIVLFENSFYQVIEIHALGRTVDDQMIFDSDYYLNTIIPECATYLGCEQIESR